MAIPRSRHSPVVHGSSQAWRSLTKPTPPPEHSAAREDQTGNAGADNGAGDCWNAIERGNSRAEDEMAMALCRGRKPWIYRGGRSSHEAACGLHRHVHEYVIVHIPKQGDWPKHKGRAGKEAGAARAANALVSG